MRFLLKADNTGIVDENWLVVLDLTKDDFKEKIVELLDKVEEEAYTKGSEDEKYESVDKYEDEYERGYDDGYKEGYEEGKKD